MYEHIASNKRWKLRSPTTPLSFDVPSPRNPSEYIRIYLTFLETRNTGLHLPMTVCVYLHSNFSGGLGKTICSAWVRFGRSRSSKVIDFGTNRKHVCDFLLARHRNLGPILHRFGDIAGFLCSWVTPPVFHPNLGVFPLHQITHVGVSPSRSLKLFGREIIFEEFQPMWSRYLNVTDGRTDGWTTYYGITARC